MTTRARQLEKLSKKEYNRQYYRKNREKLLAQKNQYYEENKEIILDKVKDYNQQNKIQRQQYHKEYRQRNLDNIRQTQRQYYEAHREQVLERNRQWCVQNPKQVRAIKAKRRAAKIQRTPAWADLIAIREFYKNCPKGHEVDHIIPLQGKNVCGLHVLENLQYLPMEENRRKGNTYVHDSK